MLCLYVTLPTFSDLKTPYPFHRSTGYTFEIFQEKWKEK